LHKPLLESLVCPHCLGPLEFCPVADAADDEVAGAGELRCADGWAFPVTNGIAGFVPETTLGSQTVRSFGQKWARHRYYREHTRGFYTSWYLQRYGFGNEAGLQRFLADKRAILDAGTGAARDASNFAKWSTADIFAVDTSREALEVAARDLGGPRLGFVHADIHQLPFADGFFDFINCDQVIHHTPAPRLAFESLVRKLQTGGIICCYVYRKKAAIREFTDDFVRRQVCGLTIDDALAACEPITKLGRALAAMKATIEVPEDIPALGIKKGRFDLQRFFHWNLFKCFWNEEFDFFTNNIVNVDWYHPENCHRFEPDEFRGWFDGWEIQAWDVQDAGISCRARKR